MERNIYSLLLTFCKHTTETNSGKFRSNKIIYLQLRLGASTMKISFLLQRRFAYTGHAMAIIFQKKYGIRDFCGYVKLRESLDFLISQKDIKYSKLLLEEDIIARYKDEPLDVEYLKYLEAEYGLPNLWPYIEVDRIVRYNMLIREYPYNTPHYTHEEMMRIVQVTAKAIIAFLRDERPNVVCFSVVGSISSMLLYHIAKKEGIQTLLIRNSCIGNKYSLTENYERIEYADNTFSDIRKNRDQYKKYILQAEKFLTDFRNKPMPYSIVVTPEGRPINRKRQFAFLLPNKIFGSIYWLFKMVYAYYTGPHREDYSTIKPWHYVWDRLKRKARVLIGFDDLYDEVDFAEDFAFFPLQSIPEMATMLYSPFYTDQLWLIKQVSRSLPIHYKLYVKEAPAMFGYRPRQYYKELKKIPNVKLVKPTTTSFDLIKNSKIVTTNTGTAGFEALFFKKPVVTFGHAFYNTLPFVKRCREIENLPWIIKDQLENFKYDEQMLIDFIAALLKESADVNLIQLWSIEGGDDLEKKEEELEPLVDLIAEKIGLKPVTKS